MSIATKPLCISSGQGNYDVNFFSDLEALVKKLNSLENGFLIVDSTVYELYADFFSSLKKFSIHVAPALESEKTLAGVERFLCFLQQKNATKNATILAIGGGVIQDIATFVAHIYYRGISWIYVPTTLLSMADSCIGAKCGINLNAFKNQLGFFQSPAQVLIADRFLLTLSDPDLRSGYGEILKLFLIGNEMAFDALVQEVNTHGFRNQKILDFIDQSLRVKQNIIEQDEYESDLRRVLNYGHTFCHSLEAITGYAVPHGLAVAWGVDIANYVSMKKGLLLESHYRIIHDFIAKHFHQKVKASYSAEALIQGMKRDKKAAAGNVSLILLRKPGEVEIVTTPLDEKLQNFIQEYLHRENVFAWH